MMDAPTFPIGLVSNGIHHIVTTRLIIVEKLVDSRIGLALHHLNQANALWSEADFNYMLTKNPDPEFSAVSTLNFNQLVSNKNASAKKRADKATGLKLSTDCTHMPHDWAFGVKYSSKNPWLPRSALPFPLKSESQEAFTDKSSYSLGEDQPEDSPAVPHIGASSLVQWRSTSSPDQGRCATHLGHSDGLLTA